MSPRDLKELIRLINRAPKRELLDALFELARRSYTVEAQAIRERITKPTEAYRALRSIATQKKECLMGLYLDAQNTLIHREVISIGSLNVTRTAPREILFPAVHHMCLGFILGHNHPSGCLDPSSEDIDFTRSIITAANLLGIELYDHVIVTANGFTSLRERGLL